MNASRVAVGCNPREVFASFTSEKTNMNTALQKPEIDFDSIKSRVESFLVENSNQYLLASNELILLKRHRNAVVSFFAEMKQSAHTTWKAIVSREKFFTDQIDTFEGLLKRRMLAFTSEQERVRREQQARLQREADAKATAERARLERNAKTNQKRGNDMNAEMYKEAAKAVTAPIIAVASTVPRAAGITAKKVWKAKITNMQAFVAAAAANQSLAQFIAVDCVGMVRQGWRECPGVEFHEEEIISARVS